ncbi:MAG: zinc ribbon domain-containing protein [Mariprofundaceae bacterium]|nr:zinc ribbon domain-containing protein [Mariprofundaceae bacterium]
MSCGHDNPEGQAFCCQCGAILAHRSCSQHHANPATAAFCGTCGESLTAQEESSGSDHNPHFIRFDLRQMLREAEFDAHQAIASKEVVSQEDIRKLLEKRRRTS